MIRSVNDNLTGGEGNDIESFVRNGYVDIHCHCLPSIDDGPATMSEALVLCRALVEDSITAVIATPHQLGRFSDCNGAAQIRKKVFVLNEELKKSGIALTVVVGADVRVDERICQLLEADKILTLADGGRYILLELPHEVFINIEPLLAELSSMGVQAVISHLERHCVLAKQHSAILKWVNHSALLQVTAGSLLGEFGVVAQRAAWHFLRLGWSLFVATDSHDVEGRRPCMRAAYELISSKLGETIAHRVCIENPLRVLKGQDIVPIESIGLSAYKQ